MAYYNFIVPYRDRPNSLREFLRRFPLYIETQTYISNYNIIIVEQEKGKPFNLAKLINVGFDMVASLPNYNPNDCFVFHPVDAIPLSGSYQIPEQAFTMFVDNETVFIDKDETLYGKAHGFRNEIMKNINGYPNNYWGWGYEDDDMQFRLRCENIQKFVSVMTFEYLMQDANRSGVNLDIPNADFSRKEENLELLQTAKKELNYTKNGLTNLSYTVLSKAFPYSDTRIQHVVVSI